jgi:hypothetical protein
MGTSLPELPTPIVLSSVKINPFFRFVNTLRVVGGGSSGSGVESHSLPKLPTLRPLPYTLTMAKVNPESPAHHPCKACYDWVVG